MSKGNPSKNASPPRKEKEKARKARLARYQTEPVREGNILVQVPDQGHTHYDSEMRMGEKMDEIMRLFDQTHIGR